jgi:hypothetical protein
MLGHKREQGSAISAGASCALDVSGGSMHKHKLHRYISKR